MSINVLIVCESNLIGSVLRQVIVNYQENISVIGFATKAGDAIRYAENGRCDVVLIHSELRCKDALLLVKQFSTDFPDVETIVFDLPKNPQIILPYLESGASGYILEDDTVPQMIAKIRAVHAKRPIICPSITAALMERVAELTNANHASAVGAHSLSELTPRELEVLSLLGRDLSNREIANHLYIEVGTVKNHVHSILKKLGVRSRYDARAFLPMLHSMPKNGATSAVI